VHETFRIGRIAGIRVGVNWTVALIAMLLAWALATQLLPTTTPDRPVAEYWVAAAIAALLFFISLLAHELAHAIVARREGLEVDGITLWLLGGVAQLRGEARTPGAEARIAGVGPLVSFIIGLVFAGAALAANLVGLPPLVVAAAGWLGGINLVLAAFNMLPGAPLDGGRLLRAIVWRWRGDALKATRVSTGVGRALGFGLIAFGLFELVAGQDLGGMWTMLLGFFLVNAATVEHTTAELTDAIRDLRVAAVMDSTLMRVPGGLRLDTFATHVAMEQRASAYLVVGAGGEIVGVVTPAMIGRIPPKERRERRLDEIARPVGAVPVAGPDELVATVLARQTVGSGGVIVLERGEPIGFMGPREIEAAVEKARLIGRDRRPHDGGADQPSGAPNPS
jgi:Zn-dependent protease